MDLIIPDFGTLFWMLLAFSIVFFILKKFAWSAILGILKERESSIEEALNSAKNAKNEMAQLKADNAKIIEEAKVEREVLLKEARAVKDQIIKEAKENAAKEASKMIESARQNIESDKKAALADIKKQVIEIAIATAEKVLQKELKDKKEQEKLINSYLENFN